VQGAGAVAWECCGSGFQSALEVLAAVQPARRDAAALAAVVTFLLKSSGRCTCQRCVYFWAF
jgi:hypothetical protein